jgi:hypothetical protein
VARPRDIGQMRKRREISPKTAVRATSTRPAPLDPASVLTANLKASLDTWLLECEGIRRMNAITRFFSYLHTPLKPGEKRWGSEAPERGK